MWFKFHNNRFTGFKDIMETVRKNVDLRKTHLKFFMKKSYLKLICDVCTQYFWINLLSKNVNKKKIDFSKLIKWIDPLNERIIGYLIIHWTMFFTNFILL